MNRGADLTQIENAPPSPWLYPAVWLVARFIVVTGLIWWVISYAWPVAPVDINVRWQADVTTARRVELERQFQLTAATYREGTTWQYRLGRWTPDAIRAIVESPEVADTHHLDRETYTPVFPPGRQTERLSAAAAIGIVILALPVAYRALPVAYRRTARWRAAWWSEFRALAPPVPPASTATVPSPRAAIAVVLGAALIALVLASIAGTSTWSMVRALVVVYVGGYVVGSLFIVRPDSHRTAIMRTIAGLLLTGLGFLLSLVCSLPWFAIPAVIGLLVIGLRRRDAFLWPGSPLQFGWDGLLAGAFAVTIVSPLAITFVYMAPGPFPPVFYNVDTAYALEKVHALVQADGFPPPSLSNLGIARTYHYGTHAVAALISRASGLLPHHALFAILLPLLTAGVIAAAATVARLLAPRLPLAITVPLLLVSVPSLSRPFWQAFGPMLWATAFDQVPLARVLDEVAIAGIVSNVGQNIGGDFLILATIAGIAAAPRWGWALPVFLIGTAAIFKTTLGLALVSGFAVAEIWNAVTARRFPPSPQAVMVGSVFAATYGVFFMRSFESPFRVQLYPFEHLRNIVDGGDLWWLAADALWLFLPVLVVATARLKDPEKSSAPMLVMIAGPLLAMNSTRLAHVGEGGEGAGLDWVQISHAVPFLVHAFALSLASRRWDQLGSRRRLAFLVTLALVVTPIVVIAGRYTWRLIGDPARGYEFVDNRPLGEALAVIPIPGSLIVTNDLRYPANDFGREDRQLQIAALFGHQAFAANFAYEPVEHRRPLQRLLQSTEWTPAILEAASKYRWTHFVVRKDFVHPAGIPLTLVFENDVYAVYAFFPDLD